MRWLVLAPLMALVVLFALSNRQPVSLSIWPLDLTWQASLSIAVLAVGAFAFVLGALMVWFASLGYRRRVRRANAEIRRLEKEVETMRAREQSVDSDRLMIAG